MSKKHVWHLRQDMRRILRNLDDRWVRAAGTGVCQHLTKLLNSEVLQPVEHILAWVPFFHGEVDLSSFINQQLESRNVYLPRLEEDNCLTFWSLQGDWQRDLESGLHGIPAPPTDSSIQYNTNNINSTVILMPGIAFDKHGIRLGRRGAHYEQWISKNHLSEVYKIGICWSLQVVSDLPEQDYSLSVDWICHEEGVIHTGLEFLEDGEDFEE